MLYDTAGSIRHIYAGADARRDGSDSEHCGYPLRRTLLKTRHTPLKSPANVVKKYRRILLKKCIARWQENRYNGFPSIGHFLSAAIISAYMSADIRPKSPADILETAWQERSQRSRNTHGIAGTSAAQQKHPWHSRNVYSCAEMSIDTDTIFCNFHLHSPQNIDILVVHAPCMPYI